MKPRITRMFFYLLFGMKYVTLIYVKEIIF